MSVMSVKPERSAATSARAAPGPRTGRLLEFHQRRSRKLTVSRFDGPTTSPRQANALAVHHENGEKQLYGKFTELPTTVKERNNF
ncbi:hypothetical protein EVAR_83330_1 [Eumeta japonica]|uniref:Uncharacterized protein n=1 Tax=Eumeta variegata TaxID=151549 RepID=A0A4C1VWS3_EUMVA|nr:hypothetical protein EVAR_83330_1 [Eumeta japonica]